VAGEGVLPVDGVCSVAVSLPLLLLILLFWTLQIANGNLSFLFYSLGQRMADQAIKNTMRDLDKEMDARASSQPREDKEV
jgi:hypothetical protein